MADELQQVAIRMVEQPPLYSNEPMNNPDAAVRVMNDFLAQMFEEETREDTITFIQEVASFLEEDDELRDLMNSASEKLKQWTEEEFKAFDFSPYLFEEDDEDES